VPEQNENYTAVLSGETIYRYMKITFVLLSGAAALCISGCHTVHKVEHGTENVADKTGHAVGHATEKVGNAISNGGHKLEEKTDQ
jgi:hypothetical protein